MSMLKARFLIPATSLAIAALAMAGCAPAAPAPSSTSSNSSQSSSPAPSTDSASASASASATQTASSSASPSSTTKPSATTPAAAQAGTPPRCVSANLAASTDGTGGGAAGSNYIKLILTNKGTSNCLLKGYSGVSLTAGPTGEPIGKPADRTAETPVDVILKPGQSGHAVLQYNQPGKYQGCQQVQAAGIRIYPPEDTGSVFIARPMAACANTQIALLTLGIYQAG
ncbi:DUF4232 domain-containing protein [Pseudarthrobacter sp. J1763]|uniref:DUF4232 domain-containing protein n=1 Tax=Pseudarthrobacter sp. J1763 TaxID=3420445 RepID=UPI003D2DDA2E